MMRKNLFLTVSERLKTLRDEKGEPAFRHIGLWNESLVLSGQAELATPALFIEFSQVDWKGLPQGIQEGDLPLRLHIINRWDSTADEANSYQQKALETFELTKLVHKALQGFSNTDFGSFTRTTSAISHPEKLMDCTETYVTHVISYPGI